MIHRPSYVRWANICDERLPPARVRLRSAMRTMAAATSTGFRALADDLYDKTRRMLESRDVHDDNPLPWVRRCSRTAIARRKEIELECIQAWLLLAYYDFMRKSEQQALLTAGRAFRLLQLSGLLDIDLDHDATSNRTITANDAAFVRQNGLPDGSWRETEGKRRTVWVAFILDRLSGMLNDRPWALLEELVSLLMFPLTSSPILLLCTRIKEQLTYTLWSIHKICTRLPMPEDAFQAGQQPSIMDFLPDAMSSTSTPDGSTGKAGCGTLSPFAECVVLASLCGHSVAHLRLVQSSTFADCTPESQVIWKRHQWLAAATSARIEEHTRSINAAASRGDLPPKCDPMWAFNRVLACGAAVSLSDATDANPWRTLEDSVTAMTYTQLTYPIAAEVVLLLQNLPRIAFLKVC